MPDEKPLIEVRLNRRATIKDMNDTLQTTECEARIPLGEYTHERAKEILDSFRKHIADDEKLIDEEFKKRDEERKKVREGLPPPKEQATPSAPPPIPSESAQATRPMPEQPKRGSITENQLNNLWDIQIEIEKGEHLGWDKIINELMLKFGKKTFGELMQEQASEIFTALGIGRRRA